MKRITLIAGFVFAATMLAAPSQDFSSAAAESSQKARTAAGTQYGVKFIQTASKSVADAMRGCDNGDFAIGSTCDLVFIISASGRIERLLQGSTNPFAQCITSHLHVTKTLAKPPGAHWPVHVRVLHGRQKTPPANPDIMLFADNAEKQ
jgi:hypothetical protein